MSAATPSARAASTSSTTDGNNNNSNNSASGSRAEHKKKATTMTEREETILRSLKAEQSVIDRAEREKFQGKPKGGAGAKIQGAIRKFAEGVSLEHDVPITEVMNTPEGPAMTPKQLEKALREESSSHSSQENASGRIMAGGPAADMQSALAKLRVAEARAREENLNLETWKAFAAEGQPLSREQEDMTLAMIRATAEQLMIDEIESRTKKNGGARGVDTRIWKGSAAAKAQGAFAKYATALAMERGVSPAEIESSAAFFSPVPSVRMVAERVLKDAAVRESFESKTHGSVLRGGVAAKMHSAARKLFATTEAGRQAGGAKGEESGKLLKGDEPLYVLGVTEEAENETLAFLQHYVSKFGGELTNGLQRAKNEAEMAVSKYAGAVAFMRGLSVNEMKQKAKASNVVLEKYSDDELLDRLRHQTIVLLVEERRVGTKNVEKGSAASLMQSAVDHFARSLRLVRQNGQKTGGGEERTPSPAKAALVAQDTPHKQAAAVGEE